MTNFQLPIAMLSAYGSQSRPEIENLPLSIVMGQEAVFPGPVCRGERQGESRQSPADRICTSHVERQNLTVRHFKKRFVPVVSGILRPP